MSDWLWLLGIPIGLFVGWWSTNRPPWKIVRTPLTDDKIQSATWEEINWMLSDHSLSPRNRERITARWYSMAGISRKKLV